MEPPRDTVLSYGRYKDAAIYFPYVVPFVSYEFFEFTRAYFESDCGISVEQANEYFHSRLPLAQPELTKVLLPPEFAADRNFIRLMKVVPAWIVCNRILRAAECDVGTNGMADFAGQFQEVLGVKILNDGALERTLTHLAATYHLHRLPSISGDSEFTELNGDCDDLSDFRVTLCNAQLIDTERATWDQIASFRADRESQKKLRRLLDFLFVSYEGKTSSFVTADLHRRLDEYDQVVRKHGFETKAAAFGAIIRSKLLRQALAGAGLMSVFDKDTQAIAIGMSAILLEVGATCLQFQKQRFEFREYVGNHPLGYIVDARNMLGSSSP